MQVVYALEVLLNLRVVELDHLDELIQRFLVLFAVHVDLKLPCPAFYPELKWAATFPL